jgi:transposase
MRLPGPLPPPVEKVGLEFKLEAVRLVREGGLRQAEAARQLGISENSLSNWLTALAAGKLGQAAGVSRVSPEQMELSRLRAENARLKMELEITKKAAAYFAKESL